MGRKRRNHPRSQQPSAPVSNKGTGSTAPRDQPQYAGVMESEAQSSHETIGRRRHHDLPSSSEETHMSPPSLEHHGRQRRRRMGRLAETTTVASQREVTRLWRQDYRAATAWNHWDESLSQADPGEEKKVTDRHSETLPIHLTLSLDEPEHQWSDPDERPSPSFQEATPSIAPPPTGGEEPPSVPTRPDSPHQSCGSPERHDEALTQVSSPPPPNGISDQVTPTINNVSLKRVHPMANNDPWDDPSVSETTEAAWDSPRVDAENVLDPEEDRILSPPLRSSAKFQYTEQVNKSTVVPLEVTRQTTSLSSVTHVGGPPLPSLEKQDWKGPLSRLQRAAASATTSFLQVAKPIAVEVGTIAKDISRTSGIKPSVSNQRATHSPDQKTENSISTTSEASMEGTCNNTRQAITANKGLEETSTLSSADDCTAPPENSGNVPLSGWSRLVKATTSTAKSAIKVSGPFLVEAASMLQDIQKDEEHPSAVAKLKITPIQTEHQVADNQGSAPEDRDSLDNLHRSCGEADGEDCAQSVRQNSVGGARSSSSHRRVSFEPAGKEKSPEGRTPGTTTTKSLTLDLTTGLSDLLSTQLRHFEWANNHGSQRLEQEGDQSDSTHLSASSSLSSPMSPVAGFNFDSSLDEELFDELSQTVTFNTHNSGKPILANALLSWKTLFPTDRFESQQEHHLAKRHIPTGYVIMASPRPNQRDKVAEEIAMEYSPNTSFSSEFHSVDPSALQKRRLWLRSPLGKQRKLMNSASFPNHLGSSLHGSRHGGSFCATFPSLDQMNPSSHREASSVSDGPLDSASLWSDNRRKSHVQVHGTSPQRQTHRMNSRPQISCFDQQARFSTIFRSVDASARRYNNNAASETLSVGPSSSFGMKRRDRLRRVSSMPALVTRRDKRDLSIRASPVSMLYPDSAASIILSRDSRAKNCEDADMSLTSVGTPLPYGTISLASARMKDGAALEDMLADLAFVKPLQIPALLNVELPEQIQQVASIRWQQLVACWKHSQVYHAILHSTMASPGTFGGIAYIGGIGQIDALQLPLAGTLRIGSVHHSSDVSAQSVPTLLMKLGKEMIQSRETCHVLRHTVSGPLTATRLLEVAGKMHHSLTDLVEDMVRFANVELRNAITLNDASCQAMKQTSYAVAIKDAGAIQAKAKRKYNGDISQVKDILRGRIIFSSGASLVCGLIRLHQRVKSAEEGARVSICRMKNSLDPSDQTNLPTGYRRIVLNLLLEKCMIVELELHLAALYNTLGEHGPTLHRQLSELASDAQYEGQNDCVDLLVMQFREPGIMQKCMKSIDICGEGLHVSALQKSDSHLSVKSASSIFLAMLQSGATIAKENPRDVPSHFCVHMLLLKLYEWNAHTPDGGIEAGGVGGIDQSKILEIARQCVMRCLAIVRQGSLDGMAGWFEYGSSTLPEVAADQSMAMHYYLAHLYAMDNSWKEVEQILQSALLGLDSQGFMPQHSAMIVMMDLSAASERNSKRRYAQGLMARALRQVSHYLAVIENDYFDQLAKSFPENGDTSCRVKVESFGEQCPLKSLDSLVMMLQNHARRMLLSRFGQEHILTTLTHNIIADALAVKANCQTVAESIFGVTSARTASKENWELALSYYQRVLHSPAMQASKGRDSKSILAAYSAARCLRQLKRGQEAYQMLGTVLEESFDTVSKYREELEDLSSPSDRSKQPASPFLSSSMLSLPSAASEPALRQVAIGFCQWQLAALAADLRQDSSVPYYLESSAWSLQLALKCLNNDSGSSSLRERIKEHLKIVVKETRQWVRPALQPST